MKFGLGWCALFIIGFIVASSVLGTEEQKGVFTSADEPGSGSGSDSGSGDALNERDEEGQKILDLMSTIPYKEAYNIKKCEDNPEVDCKGKTSTECLKDFMIWCEIAHYLVTCAQKEEEPLRNARILVKIVT